MIRLIQARDFRVLAAAIGLAAVAVQAADFSGSASCQSCHTAEYEQWQGSHHHDAMLPANDETVAANFNDTSYIHFGVTSRFFRRGGDFIVNTEDGKGARQDFIVRYTFGVQPLQQYLLDQTEHN